MMLQGVALRGLGDSNAAINCPTGMTPAYYSLGTGGGGYWGCKDKYASSWTCTWFGVGCNPKPVPALPSPDAPQTLPQLTVPGEWTPEMSSPLLNPDSPHMAEYKAEVEAAISQYQGQAILPIAVGDAADAIGKYGKWVVIGGLVLAAVVVYTVVKVR